MKFSLIILSVVLLSATNSLAQWTKINAVPSRDITALALNGDTILAATDSSILFKSTDGGITWDTIQISPNPIVTVILKVIDHNIFVTTSGSGIFSSSDGGISWTNTGVGLFPIAGIDKFDGTLYVATLGNGIYRYDSLSTSWLPINNALPSYSVNAFDLAATATSLLTSAGANGTIYRYDFSLNAWNEEFYYGILRPGLQIQQLFHADDTLFAINGNRIIRSDNDGISWSDDITGSHNGFNRRFYGGPTDFYTVTNVIAGGSWLQKRNRSAVTGTTWAVNEEFLPASYSYDILEHQGSLFLAKHDGLYVKNVPQAIVEPDANSSIIRITPNPTSSEINVFSKDRILKATILNVAGQQVYAASVGENSFHFSPGLAKGIYALDLELSNGKNIFKKVIIN